MKTVITAKVRLYPNQEQVAQFKAVTKEYQRLCNLVSQWYFDNDCKVNRKKFNKEMYRYLRAESKEINSAMVQSTYRTVEARYKTVETQLKQRPYRYQDQNTGEWYHEKRDLSWLQAVKFSRPQADYVRNINYSFVEQGSKISMNVLGQRIKVAFNGNYLNFFDPNYKLGTAKLVQLKKHWFLHIPVTIETDDWEKEHNQHIIGLDRGLRQIVTSYDEKGKTSFKNGKAIAYKRRKYAYLRSQLQSKGTKSAKRKLKRLSQKENRWISDVNHCLSKTLVDTYGQNSLFVLEDLSGVTFEKTNSSKNQTRELHSWAFYDLQTKLAYKARKNQSQVLIVSAKYTSQRCPK
ncbi:MAG: transposase, partial [Ligilactobacillus salivarius]|nr:transposase [Ligilactobacillus salivarius]